MEIEWIRLDFKGDKGVLSYKNAQGEKSLPFGLGHNEFSKFPQTGYSDMTASVPEPGHMYDCAVSADWPEEQKLRIKVQIIDKYFGNMSMEFGFKGDKVGICMLKYAEAFLDEYLKENEGEIDYIHDDDALIALAAKENAIGFLVPGMEKSQLFRGVIADGILPRKTFSMGHAREKRYYLEGRLIK